MKCSNCKHNEATVKFLQIINGEKTELFLCDNCADEIGIENVDINIPMDFSSFISDFFDSFSEQELLSALTENKQEKCNNCGLSYDEFVKTGKLGCIDCYDIFSDRIDLITKNIQGSSEHRGKKVGNVKDVNYLNKEENFKNNDKEGNNYNKNTSNVSGISSQDMKDDVDENNKIEILKMKLKKVIKEEKYEEAAKIRDEIRKLQDFI